MIVRLRRNFVHRGVRYRAQTAGTVVPDGLAAELPTDAEILDADSDVRKEFEASRDKRLKEEKERAEERRRPTTTRTAREDRQLRKAEDRVAELEAENEALRSEIETMTADRDEFEDKIRHSQKTSGGLSAGNSPKGHTKAPTPNDPETPEEENLSEEVKKARNLPSEDTSTSNDAGKKKPAADAKKSDF